jgi:hypothetical protein
MPRYELFTQATVPQDAVVVNIEKVGAVLRGFVDRRLATIGGSVSADAHEGPVPVPEALEKANATLTALRIHGFNRIAVVLAADANWLAEWGQLDRTKSLM